MRGVLVLDEVDEFSRDAIAALASEWRNAPPDERPFIVAVAYKPRPERSLSLGPDGSVADAERRAEQQRRWLADVFIPFFDPVVAEFGA